MRKFTMLLIALILAAVVTSPAHASRLWGGGGSWWDQEWDDDWDDWGDDGGPQIEWPDRDVDKCDLRILSWLPECKDDPKPNEGVPEPSAALVFGIGFAVVGSAIRRNRRR